MNDYPNIIKKKLLSVINEMAASPALFIKHPGTDFTRTRKLPLAAMLQLLISMGRNSLYQELLEVQGYSANIATTAAFVQQRDKILPFAFEFLLHEFTRSFTDINRYQGFRLIAVDGSDLLITTDPKDHDTYFQHKPDIKGYNMLHLNVLYDLCSKLYIDSCIQPRKCINENYALTTMVDRFPVGDKVIFIADRNYECYNNFAHIEKKGWNYVIRVKDIGSNGILSGLHLSEKEEFDLSFNRILTQKHTKEVRDNPLLYRFISNTSPFDFFDQNNNLSYPISFRVVRFKITDDSFETLITNLPPSSFSPDNLKELYNMRWGIETSFRDLKHSIGLVDFHAKKREYIVQEIYARMIMFNFSQMITSHVVIPQSDTRYRYQINFAVAILICKYFLRCCNNVPSLDVEALLLNNILPVRQGRRFLRKTRTKLKRASD